MSDPNEVRTENDVRFVEQHCMKDV